MTIIYLLVILIVLLIIGVILYGIFLVIRQILIKTHRLSSQLDKRLKINYWGILISIGIVLWFLKDYRTSSKDRLESVSGLKLPSDYQVIKDEYQDMGPDYCIHFEIQLDSLASVELARSIRTSKFYNPGSIYQGEWADSDLVRVDSIKAVWLKASNGYGFRSPAGSTDYFITFDTISNRLMYEEVYD